MADPRMLAALDYLLAECVLTSPLGVSTSKQLANDRLPEPLEQFLAEYTAHPAEAGIAMSGMLHDLGARVFRSLLIAGLKRRQCDTDLAQNREDSLCAAHLLSQLAVECVNTPFVPQATAEVVSRVANALYDVWGSNSRPALFDGANGEKGHPFTAGQQCEGHLAAALEIVVRGGMKLAAAKGWVEAEMRAAGLVDAAGDAIRGERVASWRSNFRKNNIGAKNARLYFAIELERCKRLLVAPRNERKLAACQDHARRLICMLARLFNRTVPAPLKH
jgi:hypothetical protein